MTVESKSTQGVRRENAAMFPKESRPTYLQDDEYFNSFPPEVALQAVMGWAQTMAVQKSNQLKEKKAEKASDMKTNTAVKQCIALRIGLG